MQREVKEKIRVPEQLNGVLPVMERFYTIQGEGYNTGVPAYFIRLGGCDVGCHWCDVKDSWDASMHPMIAIGDLIKEVLSTPAKTVVITGGEPCMYDLGELTSTMKAAGIQVFLETSGSWQITGEWDWICVSPKKFSAPSEDSLMKAHELKVVVFNKSDFDWAEKNASVVSKNCRLYLQPEWEKRDQVTPLIIDYVKANPGWRISLQTHKYLDIP